MGTDSTPGRARQEGEQAGERQPKRPTERQELALSLKKKNKDGKVM